MANGWGEGLAAVGAGLGAVNPWLAAGGAVAGLVGSYFDTEKQRKQIDDALNDLKIQKADALKAQDRFIGDQKGIREQNFNAYLMSNDPNKSLAFHQTSNRVAGDISNAQKQRATIGTQFDQMSSQLKASKPTFDWGGALMGTAASIGGAIEQAGAKANAMKWDAINQDYTKSVTQAADKYLGTGDYAPGSAGLDLYKSSAKPYSGVDTSQYQQTLQGFQAPVQNQLGFTQGNSINNDATYFDRNTAGQPDISSRTRGRRRSSPVYGSYFGL